MNNLLPTVLNAQATTIVDQLTSVKPMTEKELVNGREIRKQIIAYDWFDSYDKLKEFILEQDINHSNLSVSEASLIPFNLDDKIYYRSESVISISCVDRSHRFPIDELSITLESSLWNLNKLKKVIIDIQAAI